MTSSVKRKVLFPMITMIIGCVLAILLLEILLRVTGLAPARGLHSVSKSAFTEIPGIWSPGQDFVWRELSELPYHVTINSLGYRGSELNKSKRSEEFRILMVGDSFTFGSYVNNDETMPTRVESKLNQVCVDKEFEVINAGVLGSSITAQEQMIERGLITEPDLVVLVFHNNDIDGLIDPLWDRMAENRELKSQFPVSLLWPLLRETAVWNYSLRAREILRTKQSVESNINNNNEAPDSNIALAAASHQELRTLYQSSLARLSNRLTNLDIPFVFVVYPGHLDVRDQPFDDTVLWAYQTAEAEKIDSFNLLDALQTGLSDNVDAGFLLPVDAHPSSLGHAIAGEALADFLLQRPQINAVCG